MRKCFSMQFEYDKRDINPSIMWFYKFLNLKSTSIRKAKAKAFKQLFEWNKQVAYRRFRCEKKWTKEFVSKKYLVIKLHTEIDFKHDRNK